MRRESRSLDDAMFAGSHYKARLELKWLRRSWPERKWNMSMTIVSVVIMRTHCHDPPKHPTSKLCLLGPFNVGAGNQMDLLALLESTTKCVASVAIRMLEVLVTRRCALKKLTTIMMASDHPGLKGPCLQQFEQTHGPESASSQPWNQR